MKTELKIGDYVEIIKSPYVGLRKYGKIVNIRTAQCVEFISVHVGYKDEIEAESHSFVFFRDEIKLAMIEAD